MHSLEVEDPRWGLENLAEKSNERGRSRAGARQNPVVARRMPRARGIRLRRVRLSKARTIVDATEWENYSSAKLAVDRYSELGHTLDGSGISNLCKGKKNMTSHGSFTDSEGKFSYQLLPLLSEIHLPDFVCPFSSCRRSRVEISSRIFDANPAKTTSREKSTPTAAGSGSDATIPPTTEGQTICGTAHSSSSFSTENRPCSAADAVVSRDASSTIAASTSCVSSS